MIAFASDGSTVISRVVGQYGSGGCAADAWPAVRDAELEPLRADEERTGGIIHKPMFERLLLCDYALADLTTANANVFYELGVRHAARPATTMTIFAKQQPIPFDVNFLRSMAQAPGIASSDVVAALTTIFVGVPSGVRVKSSSWR